MELGGRAIKHLLLLVFLGASLSACSSSVKNTADYKIAYNVLYDGYSDNYEIFVMNADGSEQTNISNSPGIDWVYYAYDDKLYFISDRDSTSRKYFLYEMKWDGSEVRRVTDFLVHDSWIGSRKNGSEFVISANLEDDADTRDLFIIDINGNILSRVTDDDYQNTDPQFSPDGLQIVYRSYREGIDELFIVDADGSNLRQLTNYPDDDSTAKDWEYHVGPPQWVDSKKITYMSKQNGNYSIFSVSPDGGESIQSTPDTTKEGYPANEGWHSWSRDKKLIAYNATEWDGNYNIYIMNADGSNPRQLTTDKWYEQAPLFVYPKKENE